VVKNKQKAYKHIYLCTSRTGRLHSTAGRGAVGSSDLARARAVDMPYAARPDLLLDLLLAKMRHKLIR